MNRSFWCSVSSPAFGLNASILPEFLFKIQPPQKGLVLAGEALGGEPSWMGLMPGKKPPEKAPEGSWPVSIHHMRAQQKGAGRKPARRPPWLWPCWLLDLGLPVSKTKSNKFLLFISYTISSVPKCTEIICKLKKIFFVLPNQQVQNGSYWDFNLTFPDYWWDGSILCVYESFVFSHEKCLFIFFAHFSTRLPDFCCYLPVIYIFWMWIICQSHVQQINVLSLWLIFLYFMVYWCIKVLNFILMVCVNFFLCGLHFCLFV